MGVSWIGGIKQQWDCRQQQFSAFSLAISSETLEIRPTLNYIPVHSPSSAFTDPKMNNLE